MTHHVIVGIDPGREGGFAVLNLECLSDLVLCCRMPRNPDGTVDAIELNVYLRKYAFRLEPPAVIEHVHAMAGDGRVAAFNFGDAFGTARTVLELNGYSVHKIEPAAWKQALRLPGGEKGKAASVQIAAHLWPKMLNEKTNHNAAEAALIALYGAKLLGDMS